MKTMVKGYEDAGAKYGIKVVTANTNNDQAKETELIQTYMAQGVSGIAIAPLSKDASIANLKQAADQGHQGRHHQHVHQRHLLPLGWLHLR